MTRERKRPVEKEVTIKLSSEQLLDEARKAGVLRGEKLTIEQEFKSVKADFKGRIEAKDNEISKALDAIRTGQVTKKMTVVEVFDFVSGEVYVEHEGTTVQVRVMSGEERQLGFRLPEKDKPKQDDLPLVDKEPSTPAQGGDPDAAIVNLPAPSECPDNTVFVPGEMDRPTKVKFGPLSWKLKAGESANFQKVAKDVFGEEQIMWEMERSLDVGEAPPTEPDPTQDAPQAQEDVTNG